MPNNRNVNTRKNGEIDFKLVEELGVIETYQTGWTKEANIVSWNGGTPKIDIRDWDPEHERMSKGITLHLVEAKRLVETLAARFSEDDWKLSEEEALESTSAEETDVSIKTRQSKVSSNKSNKKA
ncbi:MAG: hypothetical protein GX083_02730 [Clostridiales bacterium]|nr:hypothetical protein [Clostridiales bacterium]